MDPIRVRFALSALCGVTFFALSTTVATFAQQHAMERRQESLRVVSQRVVDGLEERGDFREEQRDATNDSAFRFSVDRGEASFETVRWGGRRYYRYGRPYAAYGYPGPYWRDYYRGGYYRPYTGYGYYGAPADRYYNYPYRYGRGVGPLRYYWR